MKTKKFVSEESFLFKWEPYLQKISELQELLFSQNPQCDVKLFIPNIPEYFFQSKIRLIQLISSIFLLHFSRAKHRNFCIKLLEEFLPIFKNFFSKEELNSIFEHEPKDMYLHFYRLGVIPFDNILKKVNQSDSANEFIYFHDIIEKNSKDEFLRLKSKYGEFFANFDSHNFFNRRKKGENDSLIALSIREDDVEKCQTVISQSNISFGSRIPFSIYETIDIVNEKENMPFLLEYAAFFGSINCFKFFLMNDAPITNSLLSYAIFGGNLEIIHLCEDFHASLDLALRSSICSFQNDFYEYFFESKDVELNNSAICCAIRNYNATYILRNLSKIYQNPNFYDDRGENPLLISSFKGFVDIVNMLSSINGIDYNVRNLNGETPIMISAINNRNLIFDLLIEQDEVDVNVVDLFGENLLTKLIKYNHIGFLSETLNRKDIIVMNPDCNQNEIFTAVFYGNLNFVKLIFNHAKYKSIVNESSILTSVIIASSTQKKWDLVDYVLKKCPKKLNLLNSVDLFFKSNPNYGDEVQLMLRGKIIEHGKSMNS